MTTQLERGADAFEAMIDQQMGSRLLPVYPGESGLGAAAQPQLTTPSLEAPQPADRRCSDVACSGQPLAQLRVFPRHDGKVIESAVYGCGCRRDRIVGRVITQAKLDAIHRKLSEGHR